MKRTIESFFTLGQGRAGKKAKEGAAPADAAVPEAPDEPAVPDAPEVERRDAAKGSGSPSTSGGAAGSDGEGGSQLTTEQKLRMKVNKEIALARRAVQQAHRVADEADGFPDLRDLLIDPSWREALGGEMKKEYFAGLMDFVQNEARVHKVFPQPGNIFRAFNSCSFNRVKVVIIGQDPYHDIGQAMGLCFSVPQGVKVPSSLQNMYKELVTDVDGFEKPGHGDLDKWACQGVLMLNACMTVRAHQAASHSKRGWEAFTDAAIRAVSKQRKGVVFLLWGKFAQDKGKVIDAGRHHVLKAPHPSGLSAHRGFFGCKHFSQCNALLEKAGEAPINWQV